MLSIEITQGNAAFQPTPEPETARILRVLADKLDDGCVECPIKDENGNTIGRMVTSDD